MGHESENYTSCDWCSWYSDLRIIKANRGRGSKRTSVDHINYYIIENGWKTEKSPGYLRKLAVTQSKIKDDQLTLMGKTLKN